MKRFFKILALGFLLALPWADAQAQQANNYWLNAATPCPSCWVPTSATNPMPVTGTFTPSGNSVVIGPTADGSPATTPPVLVGGTVDGSATGNIGVAKIDAAGLAYNAITNWGGTALGAMANYGTSPGAVLVPGVNAFVTNTVTVTGTVTAAGTTSNASSGVATSSTNTPSVAYNYAFNGTTWDQLQVDSNKNLLTSTGGAPTLATAQVSVTTGNISVASARTGRRAIMITNITGTSVIYCGNTGVSTVTGTPVAGTAMSSITLNTTAAIFCTVAATTQTVAVAETY